MTGPTTLIVGCGYLGRVVGRRLIDRGDRVFGTTRTAEKAKGLALDGIEPVVAEVLDPNTLGGFPEAGRVLYCVGFDRRSGASMRSVYLDGLANALSVLDLKKTLFVYVSSTGVYGQDDGSWVDEDSETRPTHESGRVCLEAEQLVRARIIERGGAAVILRLSGLYGPGRIIGRAGLERG
ncbi:NAD-dependent epimerase/dehydratase family protein, partial [Singulisphaera rosea]